MQTPQVRVLHLKKGDDKKHDVHRLQRGCVLRFLLDSTLHNNTVRLFCNHPLTESIPFNRSTYHELEWQCSTPMRSAITDVYAEIVVAHSGSFNYYFTIDESSPQKQADGQGFFLVDPELMVGQKKLPLDGVCMQTVISKLLGPFSEWESRLMVAKETGYNMIHFTPVQELGISNSAYCIRDQHRLSFAYSNDKRLTHLMIPHMKDLVDKMHSEWGIFSVTDLVLNHTAVDSPLLECHPECAYNMDNSPHLRPAYVMDRIFHYFSLEVADNQWESRGVPAELSCKSHFDAMRHVLHNVVFPRYNLFDFYLAHEDNILKEFRSAVNEERAAVPTVTELTLKPDPEFRRTMTSIDMDLAVKLFYDDRSENDIHKLCEDLRQQVAYLNRQREQEMREHIHAAIENFISCGLYRFVSQDGPRLGRVTKDNPIMIDYFVSPESHQGSMQKAERMMGMQPQLVMAISGWVIGDDPQINFAKDILAPDSYIYLRRELITWDDNIKLRYGQKPEDCPHLWEHMKIYAETSAQVFHGVRLDNTHGTPLHVAEYMVDAARRKRPELYVVADLFTGDANMDCYFVNRLGINTVVREMLRAESPGGTRRMVAEFSGEPLGSFTQPRVRALASSKFPAVFFDQAHDNDSPIKTRSVYSVWPSAAVAAVTRCAIGSNRGYDELVPHNIDLVKETRLYPRWARNSHIEGVNLTAGICRGKHLLNQLHTHLAQEGYTEIHVEDLHHGVVEVIRHNPITHQSIILVASLVFSDPQDPNQQLFCKPVRVEGMVEEVLFEGNLCFLEDNAYVKSEDVLNGLPSTLYLLDLREHLHVSRSHYCKEQRSGDTDRMEIFFNNFTPGTVVALKCSISEIAKKAVTEIKHGLNQFGHMLRAFGGKEACEGKWKESSFRNIVCKLSLGDLNRVLYRVSVEEEDDGFGFATYNIPNYGPLCYCGLRGVMSVLAEARPNNNLGHPVCHNLREGPWLMDYISARLQLLTSTKPLGDWFEKMFSHVKEIPRFLVPCYFSAIVTSAYVVLREMALQQFSPFVKDGSTFVQALALSCTQFLGYVRSARLPPLSRNLKPSPRTETIAKTGEVEEAPVSMASGLPHFAKGHWRCWGRDTFIALRGMMLVTGRFDDARCLILAYAGALRHGLIPNLLWEGQNARYNCRDAVWWWLHAIKAYTLMAPGGQSILHEPVLRVYPTDDALFSSQAECEQPLYAVMQEALSRHMSGIEFRERDAGPQLDPYMIDKGFNVEAGVAWPKGYVFGGNEHNCGTWMDLMGRSEPAGNWGQPATPRDGAAVEIVGLSASVLSWLTELSARDVYPYNGVSRSTSDYMDQIITFEEWSQSIKDNFEKDFYISPTPNPINEPHPERIFRRGMYKDCLNATQIWADYQLRPNFCVAMVVAPDLFNEDNAWKALDLAEKVLLGPLGMKTLDPSDWNYSGQYSVHTDPNSADPKTSAGFNYHNGPEFVWLLAYFLRAKLYFASKLEKRRKGVLRQTVELVNNVLCEHYKELLNSPWKSLPQLTDADGAFCEDSCRAQAVSDGCILEILFDLERMGTAHRPSAVDFHGPLRSSSVCHC